MYTLLTKSSTWIWLTNIEYIIIMIFRVFFSFWYNSTANTGIKIQFFGAKQDASRVQEIIQKMVDRGRVGNVTLVPSSLVFRDEAALQIEVCIFNYKYIYYILFAHKKSVLDNISLLSHGEKINQSSSSYLLCQNQAYSSFWPLFDCIYALFERLTTTIALDTRFTIAQQWSHIHKFSFRFFLHFAFVDECFHFHCSNILVIPQAFSLSFILLCVFINW